MCNGRSSNFSRLKEFARLDSFREKQNKNCAVGGIHCLCCNGYRGKQNNHKKKQRLNHIVRAEMKVETENIIKEEIN